MFLNSQSLCLVNLQHQHRHCYVLVLNSMMHKFLLIDRELLVEISSHLLNKREVHSLSPISRYLAFYMQIWR
ncbi:Protein of unknown function [Anaplasma phagocytophilum]|uniref:Uncharacterized protein n=1 Tax=Anaplasma phagocytophilum TaxID=948 RepID=A0A098EH16_ANAPH|nr:Protein of unknown function [Anaplasma phagocytophilum]